MISWRNWRARARQGAAGPAEVADHLADLKSDFLKVASHELRGPLAIARGYVSMLLAGDFGPQAERTTEVLDTVERKLRDMSQLIDEMLEIARLEGPARLTDTEVVDLASVTREAVEWAERERASEDHRLVLDVRGGEVTVLGDSEMLLGALCRLLDNAVKYSPDGGSITSSVHSAPGWAHVTITDEGLGIADVDATRLFQRFGRVVTPENSGIPGAGLGLFSARRIISMHGGRISVGPAVPRGTTVTVSLPRA